MRSLSDAFGSTASALSAVHTTGKDLLLSCNINRVSTTPGNPGNLMEFIDAPGKFNCRLKYI